MTGYKHCEASGFGGGIGADSVELVVESIDSHSSSREGGGGKEVFACATSWVGSMVKKSCESIGVSTDSSATISNKLERLFLLEQLLCLIKYFWAWLATWVGVLDIT